VVVMCAHCGRVGMMPQPNSGVADLTCQCGNPVNIATPGVLLAFLQTGQGTVLRSSDGLSNAAAAAAAAAAIGAARAQQARANRGAPSELVKLLPTLLFKGTADITSSSSDKAQSWRCEAAEDLARCDCSDAAKSLTTFQEAPLCRGRAAVALVLEAETTADTTTDAATGSTAATSGISSVSCWSGSCTTDTAAVMLEDQQQHEDEDKVSCRVCLCDYEHGEEMRVLPCLHRVSCLLCIILRSIQSIATLCGSTFV
jgi:hypothetical protein